MSQVAELLMPKAKGRFEFKAPSSWIERAEKVAEGLGLSLSAYIRLILTQDMERREAELSARKPKGRT